MDNKKLLLMIFFGMFLIVSLNSVSAVKIMTLGNYTASPGNSTNHTTTLFLNVTFQNGTDINLEANASFNVTIWYNLTGTWTYLGNFSSCSVGAVDTNASCWGNISISDATDGIYSLNATLCNSSDSISIEGEGNLSHLILFDSNPPVVNPSDFSSPVIGGNYSGTSVSLNVTIVDNSGIDTVFFNITDNLGAYNRTYTATQSSGTNEWTATLSASNFTDGHYNITVWTNSSAFGHINNTALIYNVTFDQTGPTIALTRESESRTSINMNISVVDVLSSAALSLCSVSVDKVGTSSAFSGSGATQTLISTDLSCSTTYKYIVTCRDRAGNSASDTESFTTDPCGGSSGPSGGTSTGAAVVWTNTYVIADEQFEEGFTKELKAEERVKVKISGATHHVGVKTMTENSATIEISSNPVSVTLEVGEEAKIDVDEDSIYDIYVKLNAILNGKADVLVKKISEAYEGDESVSTTGEIEDVGGVSWWTRFIDWLKGLFS